jgi:hypothetical protein
VSLAGSEQLGLFNFNLILQSASFNWSIEVVCFLSCKKWGEGGWEDVKVKGELLQRQKRKGEELEESNTRVSKIKVHCRLA